LGDFAVTLGADGLGKFVTRRRAVLEGLTQGDDRELQLAKFTTIRRLVGGKRDQRVELRHVFAPPFGNVSLADAENRSGSQSAEPS
jgi:hypothetical protein